MAPTLCLSIGGLDWGNDDSGRLTVAVVVTWSIHDESLALTTPVMLSSRCRGLVSSRTTLGQMLRRDLSMTTPGAQDEPLRSSAWWRLESAIMLLTRMNH